MVAKFSCRKNTFKSDSFNRLVQLYSVIRVIEEHKVRKIVLSCSSKKLRSALNLYCKQNSLSYMLLPSREERGISRLLDNYPAVKALIWAGLCLGTQLMRWIYIKYLIRNDLTSRIDANTNNPLLFVTYYPNIDTELALKGIFKNKYCLPLQDGLEEQGRDIIWAAMYVHNVSIPFRESLRYAKKFITNGYHFVFLEEFLTLTSFAKILMGLLYMIREILGNRVEIEFTGTKDEAHYSITPYSFVPKIGQKLVSHYYVDIGQGLLECINELYNSKLDGEK